MVPDFFDKDPYAPDDANRPFDVWKIDHHPVGSFAIMSTFMHICFVSLTIEILLQVSLCNFRCFCVWVQLSSPMTVVMLKRFRLIPPFVTMVKLRVPGIGVL